MINQKKSSKEKFISLVIQIIRGIIIISFSSWVIYIVFNIVYYNKVIYDKFHDFRFSYNYTQLVSIEIKWNNKKCRIKNMQQCKKIYEFLKHVTGARKKTKIQIENSFDIKFLFNNGIDYYYLLQKEKGTNYINCFFKYNGILKNTSADTIDLSTEDDSQTIINILLEQNYF